mgnify:CR=1 FL=1
MKRLVLGIVLSVALVGCSDNQESTTKATSEKHAAADVAAGKAYAERECKGCHGLNGGGTAPAIPHLAAQHERYLLASIKARGEAWERSLGAPALHRELLAMVEEDQRVRFAVMREKRTGCISAMLFPQVTKTSA